MVHRQLLAKQSNRHAAALVAPAACTHVPLSTAWRMRHFDPSSADPMVLRAAVRIPDFLMPMAGGAKLVLRYSRDGEVGVRESEYLLRELTAPVEVAPLASQARPGASIHVFKVDPAAVNRMRAMQQEVIRARREAPGKVRGSVTVAADACRSRDLPGGPLLLTTYVKLDEASGFVALVEDVDLRDVVPADRDLRDALPACGHP